MCSSESDFGPGTIAFRVSRLATGLGDGVVLEVVVWQEDLASAGEQTFADESGRFSALALDVPDDLANFFGVQFANVCRRAQLRSLVLSTVFARQRTLVEQTGLEGSRCSGQHTKNVRYITANLVSDTNCIDSSFRHLSNVRNYSQRGPASSACSP